ncbi:MFS transporter [uncultured Roseibium sp.]|uniref:MFS transporter n=1 Tax=uncultured Roseibium sp. TaxID=1936171 RepID=UPI002619DADD|nr:MFS transporter [uncultured Roseibium sp.]
MTRIPRQRWAVVFAFAFNGLLFGVWAGRIPAIKETFSLDSSSLGLLLLVLAGGAIMSFPVAGMLSERLGVQKLTTICAWVYGLALVTVSLAGSLPTLAAALFLFGMLHGAMDVAMNGWGAKVEQHLGRSVMPFFHAMFSLGAGIGAITGYVAVHLEISTVTHFSAVSLLGAVLTLAVIGKPENERPRLAATNDQSSAFEWPSTTLLLVGLVAFSVSMGEGAMADWSAVFLRASTGTGEAQAALGYAAFSAAMVATRLMGSRIVTLLGPALTTRLSGSIACAGLLLTISSSTLGLSLVGFSLVGIGYAVVMPLVFARAANDERTQPGHAIAAVSTLAYGGMLLGPPLVGFVASFTGLHSSFLMLALLALLAVLLAPKLAMHKSSHGCGHMSPGPEPENKVSGPTTRAE